MSWWPLALEADRPDGSRVTLRPLRRRDRREWEGLRVRNRQWLSEWESTLPHDDVRGLSHARLVRGLNREAAAGRLLPFVIALDGELVGQMHLFAIQWGAQRGGAAGYWVDQRLAGRGLSPFALAMLVDHALGPAGLHRVEVNIRPDNVASLRVVAKLGLRDEGLRRRYLHINGAWHDHRTFATTTEDLAGRRLLATWEHPAQQSPARHTGTDPRLGADPV